MVFSLLIDPFCPHTPSSLLEHLWVEKQLFLSTIALLNYCLPFFFLKSHFLKWKSVLLYYNLLVPFLSTLPAVLRYQCVQKCHPSLLLLLLSILPPRYFLCEVVLYWLLGNDVIIGQKISTLSTSHFILHLVLWYSISTLLKLTITTVHFVYHLSNSWNLTLIVTLEGNHICTFMSAHILRTKETL